MKKAMSITVFAALVGLGLVSKDAYAAKTKKGAAAPAGSGTASAAPAAPAAPGKAALPSATPAQQKLLQALGTVEGVAAVCAASCDCKKPVPKPLRKVCGEGTKEKDGACVCTLESHGELVDKDDAMLVSTPEYQKGTITTTCELKDSLVLKRLDATDDAVTKLTDDVARVDGGVKKLAEDVQSRATRVEMLGRIYRERVRADKKYAKESELNDVVDALGSEAELRKAADREIRNHWFSFYGGADGGVSVRDGAAPYVGARIALKGQLGSVAFMVATGQIQVSNQADAGTFMRGGGGLGFGARIKRDFDLYLLGRYTQEGRTKAPDNQSSNLGGMGCGEIGAYWRFGVFALNPYICPGGGNVTKRAGGLEPTTTTGFRMDAGLGLLFHTDAASVRKPTLPEKATPAPAAKASVSVTVQPSTPAPKAKDDDKDDESESKSDD